MKQPERIIPASFLLSLIILFPGCRQYGTLVEKQDTGSEIWQISDKDCSQSNIYCEIPYCSHDSRHFVYVRRNPELERNNTEIIRVRMGTWKQDLLDVSSGRVTISHDGMFYYWKDTTGDERLLMRSDLSDTDPDTAYRLEGDMRFCCGSAASDNERYYVAGVNLSITEQEFGILLIDLQEGRHEIIDRDPFNFNMHLQFEPGQQELLLVQHNRGGIITVDGRLQRPYGSEGMIYYLLSIPERKRTYLPAAMPYITSRPTGHAAWVADTKEILMTLSARGDYTAEKGNLIGVDVDGDIRTVARGYHFNHLNVSRCGRFFCCDDFGHSGSLVVGSVITGKTSVLCDSKTSMQDAMDGSANKTHAHAYLTPDLRWVIFQSDRTGTTHIYAASVPEGMLEALEINS
jgi:hypothetical protein